MIRWIVGSTLKNRFFVLVVAAALLIIGLMQLRNMTVDVLPEFNPPSVEIQTEALGLAPEEVEQLITVPLEQDLLLGVPWLKTIRSESVPGMSSIVLVFEPGTDLMRARQMVSERMTQAVALPHVSRPPTILQPLSSSSRVMLVDLSSKNLSLIQMSVLARWTIAPRLMGIPGVANVAIWGQRDRQLQVLVDPNRLRANKVPLVNVLESTANALWVSSLSFVEASTPGTGGFIDTSNQRLGIRHILPIVSPDGLAQVPIQDTTKKISDVASVVEDHQPLIGDALGSGGANLLLVVEKFPGANTLEVTRAVEAALTDMRPGLSGIETDTSIFRPVDFIESAMHNVRLALLAGFFLIALVLAAFYFEWRAAVVSLAAIPLSLLAAVCTLHLRGATMNAVTVAGLAMAVGFVVDQAVIDVENIRRRLRQNRQEGSGRPPASIIVDASREILGGMGFAVLIVLLAILPVYFVEGRSGAFVQPLAISYTLAVLASMVVALVITPALCMALLPHAPLETRAAPLERVLTRVYTPGLARVVRHPRLMVLAVAAATVAVLLAIPFSQLSLVPSFQQRDLLVRVRAAPGTSQPEMSRISGRVSKELRSIPGVRGVAAQVGRAVQGDQVVNVSSAEVWVSVDPAADYDQTTAAVRRVVAAYPGIQSDVQTYLTEQAKAAVSGPTHAIAVRVYGDTNDVLRGQAEKIQDALARVNGIVNPRIELAVEQPAIEIETDLAASQRFGIKPGDVRRAAATLLSGTQVGNLFEEQKVFDVVVWSTPETRRSIASIEDLLIDTPSGGHVRIGDVARVRIVPSESIIRHEAVKRYVDVIADVQGRSLGSVAADVSSTIQQMQFPLEYHAELLGDYAQEQAARTRLLILAAAAAIGMFFLLQAAFGSWRLAGVFLVTLPSALMGGIVAVFATGRDFSLGSLAGLMIVFGIAVRNGIALIRHYQHLQRHEGESFGPQLVLRGSGERLLPIGVTALATALGFVPALLLGDIPGLEIIGPMAVVVLCGLVTSTLLNLYVLPSMYLALRVSLGAELDLEERAEGTLEATPSLPREVPEATLGTAM